MTAQRIKRKKFLDTLSQQYSKLVVVNKPNSGHGPTILQGYLASAEEDWIFQVDSDNEIAADQFSTLWDQRSSHDLILGKRSHKTFPLARQIVSFFARQVIRIGFASDIHDVNAPFRLFRSKLLLPLIKSIPSDTFAPNILISGLASLNGFRVKEIEIENGLRTTGTVSIRSFRILRVALQSFAESIQFAIRYRFAR